MIFLRSYQIATVATVDLERVVKWCLIFDKWIGAGGKESVMNKRFIVIGRGYWGAGETIRAATMKLKEAGGNPREDCFIYEFRSELPFAPPNREATEEEADCWVDIAGCTTWVRCKRELIQEPAA